MLYDFMNLLCCVFGLSKPHNSIIGYHIRLQVIPLQSQLVPLPLCTLRHNVYPLTQLQAESVQVVLHHVEFIAIHPTWLHRSIHLLIESDRHCSHCPHSQLLHILALLGRECPGVSILQRH